MKHYGDSNKTKERIFTKYIFTIFDDVRHHPNHLYGNKCQTHKNTFLELHLIFSDTTKAILTKNGYFSVEWSIFKIRS